VIGVSAVLKKSMTDPSLLSTKVKYSKEDLENWSPVTEKYVSEGMTIQELCAASISFSDNTAMNLLLKPLGGVQGMNDFARSIEDPSFRQDNDWPAEAFSGGVNNLKDSSTPKAMVESLRKLTIGKILDKPQSDLLITWLRDTNTGNPRIRSGVPKGWLVGNKTGTGGAYGTTNDLAIIWPTNHAPLLIGAYYTTEDKKAIKREDVISAATKLIVAEFIRNDKRLENSD
jgi:beta-lactamase class A